MGAPPANTASRFVQTVQFFGEIDGLRSNSRIDWRLPPVPIIGETAYPLNLVSGAGRLWMDDQRAGRDQG